MLAGLQIEHEVGNGAFEAGQRPGQHHEASSGELGGALEVHEPEGLAEIEVLLRLEA